MSGPALYRVSSLLMERDGGARDWEAISGQRRPEQKHFRKINQHIRLFWGRLGKNGGLLATAAKTREDASALLSSVSETTQTSLSWKTSSLSNEALPQSVHGCFSEPEVQRAAGGWMLTSPVSSKRPRSPPPACPGVRAPNKQSFHCG